MPKKSTSTNYDADNIKVLKGLTAVRRRPGMYIGDTDNGDGLHHMIYEVVDNSVDEAMAGFCNKIKVIIHKDQSVTVEDNGRGIPVARHKTEKKSAAEVVMTELHAGGKFDQNLYKVAGGLHGVGVSVVNALSESLTLEVCREGHVYTQKYKQGKPLAKVKAGKKTNKTGTKVTFKFDETIFKNVLSYSFAQVAERLRELAFLNDNLSITLIDENTKKKEIFKYKGGLREFVAFLNQKKQTVHQNPIYIRHQKGDVIVEGAFQWNNSYKEQIRCYTNNIFNIDGGTHLHGLRTGLTRAINSYIANNKIKTKGLSLTGDDCREGLVAVISVKLPDPKFNSQAKHKLISSEAKGPIEGTVNEQLATFFDEKPYVAKNIINKILLAAKAREAARKARDLNRKKGEIDTLSLAGKLADCQSKIPEESEIFIVEGDSAGGSCKMGRDRRTQAILPLRGKILNVEKVEQTVMFKNKEIQNIIAALNIGVGKHLNLDNLRYHKVIIMCDSDSDGHHIACLLMTFFYRYMRELIEGGHLYIAQPPLYKIKRGKVERYIQNAKEMDRLFIENGIRGLSIKQDNRKIRSKRLGEIFDLLLEKNRIIVDAENLVGNNYLLNALVKTKLSPNKMNDKEFLKKEIIKIRKHLQSIGGLNVGFCFLKNGGFEVVYTKHIIDEKTWKYMFKSYVEHGIANEMIEICAVTRELLSAEPLRLYRALQDLNKTSLSIDEGGQTRKVDSWLKLLDGVKNKGMRGLTIQRYKGLGEMNPEQLWDTTMNPESRILAQLSINNAEKADKMFDLLMSENVEPRKKFIEKNALSVKDLDI